MWNDYEISPEDIELYRALIPDYCIERLNDGSLMGMAVINEDSDVYPVVGVVLYSFTRGYIEIEWVATSREYDLPDHGADMVRMILNKARAMGGFLGVYGRFREGDRMSEYFPGDEFVYTKDTDNVYHFRLSDVTELKEDARGSRLAGCIMLKDTDDNLRNKVMERIERDERILPLAEPVKWDSYDPELSAVYSENGTPEGLILIRDNKDELVISFLYASNPVAGITLLKKAFFMALERHGKDRIVACPVVRDISEKLVKKIVKDPKCRELIRAKADIPIGTGHLQDFYMYSPYRKEKE